MKDQKNNKQQYRNNSSIEIETTEVTPIVEEVKEVIEESPAEVETTGPETKNGIIKGSMYVNVRREPWVDENVLEVLRQGDKVKILGSVDGFYKVSTSTYKIAYISKDFVEEE